MTEEKTKDRPFHGNYLKAAHSQINPTPGQGKRLRQYESGAICLGYTMAGIFIIIIGALVVKIVGFIINFFKAL